MAIRLDINSPEVRRQLIMTLIQNTPAAYAVLSRDYKIMFLNDFFMRARKWEGPVPVGERCFDTINGGVPCPQCAVQEAIESGRPARMIRKDVLADGSATYSDDFAVPIKDPATGGVDCVLQVIVNRTEEMRLRERNNRAFLNIVYRMIRLLEKKDTYTSTHSRNVGAISAKLTRHMGLGPQAAFRAELGGMLHDLGMLFVPNEILEKRGGLSDKEHAVIREHPMFAWLLLAGMTSFDPLRDIAIAHHERWDGSGYPKGLRGDGIPVEARVTAVADAYDAMTTDRPYRGAMPHGDAVAEIKRLAGSQFDPAVVERFAQMVEGDGLDKEALVAATDWSKAPAAVDFVLYPHLENVVGRADEDAAAARAALEAAMASDAFMESIFDNTPAFYTLIDESFNVLYVSESLAATTGKPRGELLAGKCFDILDKGMRCFRQDGACPAVKALATGERQYVLVEETLGDQRLYFDCFAVPLELDCADGGRARCCLEIMFDRTREKNAQRALESDLRQLVSKIQAMVRDILPADGAGGASGGAAGAADSFGEYLDSVSAGLSGAPGAAR